MASKSDLEQRVLEGVQAHGGKASIVQVAERVRVNHARQPEVSGPPVLPWQYDMRWAAQDLRRIRKLTFSGRKWATK